MRVNPTMIQDPVLPWFHPDPSIVRTEHGYYLASSTFEWRPGIRLHRSANLATWEPAGHVLTDPELWDMPGIPNSGGALDGMLGTEDAGETRLKLDLVPHDLFVRATEWGGQVAGMVSEEVAVPHRIPDSYPRGKYLLVFDPLDGSSNIDINGTAGSIFSILRAPEPADEHRARTRLQPGTEQVCAG